MTLLAIPVDRFRTTSIVLLVVAITLSCSASWSAPSRDEPLVFAAVADIQYADKNSTAKRYYRPALKLLEQCVVDLNQRRPAFVIQLGDSVDGQYLSVSRTGQDMDRVLDVFNRLTAPKYHVIGNHCLFAGREALQRKLGLERFYYDFTVPASEKWRFVVLDGTDGGYAMVGQKQIDWFTATLAKAAANGERVVCFCHYPLLRNNLPPNRLLKPRSLLETIDHAGCVVACFAGHHHAGGYAFHNGVHYVTLKGMVNDASRTSYALVELGPNSVRVIGTGREPTRELPLRASP